MTKRNFFGDTIHTPEDSAADFAAFAEDRDAGGFYAARISDDGEESGFGWCASVDMNNASGELEVHGFATKQALTDWLIEAGVPSSEIEEEA